MTNDTFYDRISAAAVRQIADKGRGVIWRRQSHSFNPATGLTTTTYRDSAVIALFGAFREDQIDGTQVRRGDQRLLITARDCAEAPTTADLILDDLLAWQVLNVETLRPGDVALVYRLQVRR